MHCLSCDALLNDYEATRKYPNGTFVDLCNSCYKHVKRDFLVFERPDLEGVLDNFSFNDKGDDYE